MKNALQYLLMMCLGGMLLACSQGPGLDQRKLDYTTFRNEVYPVLLRDCGFHGCHGSTDRFFRVWGPGRVRLEPTLREYDPPPNSPPGAPLFSNSEVDYSKQLAESMVDFNNPSQSLLIRKPLAVEAGGAGHFGSDKFGRNVYRSVNDAGYLTLARWVVAVAKAPAATTH